MRITSLLSYNSHYYIDIIKITNAIMADKERNKGGHRISYKLEQWNKIESFDILNNIIEHVILAQFMGSLGNVNYSVSLVSKWIFILTTKTSVLVNCIFKIRLLLF